MSISCHYEWSVQIITMTKHNYAIPRCFFFSWPKLVFQKFKSIAGFYWWKYIIGIPENQVQLHVADDHKHNTPIFRSRSARKLSYKVCLSSVILASINNRCGKFSVEWTWMGERNAFRCATNMRDLKYVQKNVSALDRLDAKPDCQMAGTDLSRPTFQSLQASDVSETRPVVPFSQSYVIPNSFFPYG